MTLPVNKKTIFFIFTLLIYSLWVLWLNNFWFLLGGVLIIDVYYLHIIHKLIFRKLGKYEILLDSLELLIFAIITAAFTRFFFIEAYSIPSGSMENTLLPGDYIFVSKINYGPKLRHRSINFPFMGDQTKGFKFKNIIPSYNNKYKRLKGLSNVKQGDVIVFNYPIGDTVALNFKDEVDYYSLCRKYGRDSVINYPEIFGNIQYFPVNKRSNFIKRCTGLPGDSIQFKNGEILVNHIKFPELELTKTDYVIVTNGRHLKDSLIREMGFNESNFIPHFYDNTFRISLTKKEALEIKNSLAIKGIRKFESRDPDLVKEYIFPFSKNFVWTQDFFGPLYVPEKGSTINLDITNLPFYSRIIEIYENNTLKIVDDSIYINSKLSNSYTFKMNYFFVTGDNRHQSADSRFWGFVPEDHLIGKALIIWLSIDNQKKGMKSLRFKRMFNIIK